ncbi:MAG: hypothetical protein NTW60_04115 [Candidatus Wolfebacteria bacterium]|nr:hypothetical protein [Candidatus Wolfebacteria bacterium]
MIRETYRFFDKLEDKIRAILSRRPVIYTLIGAFAIVLFWRGVWGAADLASEWFGITPLWSNILSIIISVVVLLMTGLFVSFFIGERILISGLKQEKKIFDKTEEELKTERQRN